VIGGGAGVGAGVFRSNADKWCELGSDFETTQIGFLYGSLEVDVGENNVVVIQLTGGPGESVGISHFRTNTPATGRLSDTFDDVGNKFRNGIKDLYGY
jgi:hypothetical protein